MIHGATIRRASAIRIPAETMTIPTSHSHAGTAAARARTAATALMASGDETRLAGSARELADIVEADLGSGFREAPQERVVHRSPAGRFLERAHVGVGGAIEVVLAAHVLARGVAELLRAIGGELERGRDRLDLVLV